MSDAQVLVVGLDGAAPELIEAWTVEGCLPHLAELMERGIWGRLRSTVPPVTAAAWISFMTGKTPGTHGVLGFQTLDLSRYDYFAEANFVNATHFTDESVFQILSRAGRRVAAISVPMTYPPFQVSGVLVSGFPHPGSQAYTYPPELAQRLEPWYLPGRRLRETSSPEERIAAARYRVTRQTEAALELLDGIDWDLFTIVFNNTDAIAHYFWRYMTQGDETSPYTGAVLDAYRQADEAIGQLLDRIGPETLVIVMSDHGMRAAPEKVVHINGWLRSCGLLEAAKEGTTWRKRALEWIKGKAGRPIKYALQRHLPQRVVAGLTAASLNVDAIDWSHTRAYYVRLFRTVDGIHINLRGRQSQGIVAPGTEYEILRDEIIEGLEALRDPETGEPVVEGVMRREEVFEGPRLEEMPDLIVQYQPAYASGVGLGPTLIERPQQMHAYSKGWSATHAPDGVLIMAGGPVAKSGTLVGTCIEDLAPTILHALGEPVPADMTGRVLVEVLASNFVEHNRIRHSETAQVASEIVEGLSDVEEARIQERLRAMGYLD